MDQAKYYSCTNCLTGVPPGHKFCGRCGTNIPDDIMSHVPQFYSDMQDPKKARLILVRGEGMEGLSYHLKADEHVLGRTGQLEFPDDPFVSPRHCNFFYRAGVLVVRDEASLNGVFVRIRGTVPIAAGDTIMVGDEVMRFDLPPKAPSGEDPEGTFFYASPKQATVIRVTHLIEGGATGLTICSTSSSLSIGREDCDANFIGDSYISGKHCTIEENQGSFTITDHDSKNGTFLRIKGERDLVHGDYVFVGRKLLRVEIPN
ncbi:MAG: FHA domain-containing protein [Polyangiaceae bacterium]|nr:FHA domain-containing protein [Polyangiaceae bacterium]